MDDVGTPVRDKTTELELTTSKRPGTSNPYTVKRDSDRYSRVHRYEG